MPGRQYTSGNKYRYGYNTQEKAEEISEGHYTAKFWEYDSRIAHRWNIDPKYKDVPMLSPYVVNINNPIMSADPNGDCPWFLTVAVGALVGAAVEYGGQVASNVVSNGFSTDALLDVDVADIAIAAGEGAVIGLTGGLAAAGKMGKTAIKVVNTVATVSAAAGQGAVDVKHEDFGGTKSVFGEGANNKSVKEAGVDAAFNLVGAALGGAAPTGKKAVSGPFKAPTLQEAVKSARADGIVNRAAREEIQGAAKVYKQAVNIANETIKSVPTGVSGELIENLVGDKTKEVVE